MAWRVDIRRGLLMALLLAIAASFCAHDPEVAKQEYVERADRYRKEKKYRDAIIEYRNALKQDPRFGAARYKLAQAYLESGDARNASREFVRAADLLPDDAEVQLRAGGILLASGRYEDAKARAEQVLKQNSRNVDAQILLAHAMAGLKNLDGALAQIEEAIRLDPEQGRGYLSLGALQVARGNRPEAEAAFKKAVEIDPKLASARLALANFYWSAGRPREAESALTEALKLEPANVLANRGLAMLYLASNRRPEAEKPLKTIAETTRAVAARLMLADYYLSTNRLKDALNILRPMVNEQGASVLALSRVATIQYLQGDRPEARKTVDSILGREPKNLQALTLKGRFLFSEGKLDEALKPAEAALEADQRWVPAHYLLGQIYMARKDFARAEQSFNEVLKLNPRATAAELQLAQIHLASGSAARSVALAERAIRDRPQNPGAHLILARGLIARGELARAEAELKDLETRYPNESGVHATAGALYLAKGNIASARRAFERARELNRNSIDALTGLVSVELKTKNVPGARLLIESRLAEAPNDTGVLMLAARVHATSGDWPQAERALQKVIEIEPSQLQAYGALAGLYLRQRKLEEAKASFEDLAKRQSKPVAAHTMVGIILQTQNREAEARERYERVLGIDSQASVAANNLAWLYAEAGQNLDVALNLAQTAKARLPNSPEVNDTLGWIYYKKNVVTLAIPPLKESADKDPSNPIYHYHLGLAYLKYGDIEKARRSLETALKLKSDFQGASEARKALASITG